MNWYFLFDSMLFLLWEAANLAASSSDLSPSCTTILSVLPIPRFTSTNNRGTGSSKKYPKKTIQFLKLNTLKYLFSPFHKITFLTCCSCFCLSISQKSFWKIFLILLLISILFDFSSMITIPLALWRREKWLWCWLLMLFWLFLYLFSIILLYSNFLILFSKLSSTLPRWLIPSLLVSTRRIRCSITFLIRTSTSRWWSRDNRRSCSDCIIINTTIAAMTMRSNSACAFGIAILNLAVVSSHQLCLLIVIVAVLTQIIITSTVSNAVRVPSLDHKILLFLCFLGISKPFNVFFCIPSKWQLSSIIFRCFSLWNIRPKRAVFF